MVPWGLLCLGNNYVGSSSISSRQNFPRFYDNTTAITLHPWSVKKNKTRVSKKTTTTALSMCAWMEMQPGVSLLPVTSGRGSHVTQARPSLSDCKAPPSFRHLLWALPATFTVMTSAPSSRPQAKPSQQEPRLGSHCYKVDWTTNLDRISGDFNCSLFTLELIMSFGKFNSIFFYQNVRLLGNQRPFPISLPLDTPCLMFTNYVPRK